MYLTMYISAVKCQILGCSRELQILKKYQVIENFKSHIFMYVLENFKSFKNI